MPLDLDADDKPLDSSDSAALDDAHDQNLDGAGDGADGADSSDAQGDNADKSTLDIVRDVVGKDDAGAASPAEGKEDGSKKEDSEEAKEADDEDYSDVPFHKHPRFQHLLRAKKANEADAGRARNIDAYIAENGLTAEEVADGFLIMAAMKNDPPKAWQMLKPLVQSVLIAAGEVLPPELQKRVEAGELTPDAAAELARTSAQLKVVQTSTQREREQREQQAQQSARTALHTAAVDWARDRSVKDPSFAAKQELLKKEVAYLIATEGRPDTPEGVRAQLEKAYKAVVLPSAASRARPVPPRVGDGNQARPTGSGSASGTHQPRAQTTKDIIRQVVSRRG